MAYTNAQAREQLLAELAAAADEVGLALACLGEATSSSTRPPPSASRTSCSARSRRPTGRRSAPTPNSPAGTGLPEHEFEAARPQVREHDASAIMERAAAAVSRADLALATLQDSMLPVDVGDPPLRAGLEQVRMALADTSRRTREITRTLGR